jgi:RNA polymerase sigma factor (sigma-70 family)
LVISTIAGDASAFADLVARHERTMRAIAFYILRDHHAAEDVTQDAFVAAYQSLPKLRDPGSFGPWAATILRRRARDAASRRLQTAPLDQAANLPTTDASNDIDSKRLLAAVMALPQRERHVLMLRHFDGQDVQGIATMTGESVGTITKRISRAHARLRERLGKEMP